MAYTKYDFTNNPWSTEQSFMKETISWESRFDSIAAGVDLFIYNVNAATSVNLKLVPDSLKENYNPKVVSVSPFGVITPLNYYVGGSSKKLNFSFAIHEDIQTPNESIYEMIKELQNMAKPVYKDSTLFPPLVYFQLGDQFAGKGHLETSFTYNKPFRAGRYVNIQVSMTFTFHEEYTDDPVYLGDTYEYSASTAAFSTDTLNSDAAISNFIRYQQDPAYFATYIYADQKFASYFNAVRITVSQSPVGNMYLPDEVSNIQDKVVDQLYSVLSTSVSASTNYIGDSSYGVQLMVLYSRMRAEMNNAYLYPLSETLNAMEEIQVDFTKLQEDYNSSDLENVIGDRADGLYDMWTEITVPNESVYYRDELITESGGYVAEAYEQGVSAIGMACTNYGYDNYWFDAVESENRDADVFVYCKPATQYGSSFSMPDIWSLSQEPGWEDKGWYINNYDSALTVISGYLIQMSKAERYAFEVLMEDFSIRIAEQIALYSELMGASS